MENINSWKDIYWPSVKERVFRLQLRIYKAATNKEWEKMYKLQKLLISSQSAKSLAVYNVTQDNAGRKIPGVDKVVISSSNEKLALFQRLKLDGQSSPIRKTYITKLDGNQRPLGILTIEDRAKQMLAYSALSPQWEAQFEAESYGFRPGRSVLDALEAIFLGISKKPKWVLDVELSKCFDTINYEYLLNKCHTYPEMQKQLRSWLKTGILNGENYVFPEMGTSQGGIISSLLANIALHGLREQIDMYINTLGGHRLNNLQTLIFVRYVDDFVLMYPDKLVLENLKIVVQEFLKPIGLQLNLKKTRIVHTKEYQDSPPGFSYLGFDIIQKKKWVSIRKSNIKKESKQDFITLITPSKERVKQHKSKIREIIRKYRGVSQTQLIQKLNPIILGWALSKRTQISSKTFQALDMYLFLHLWKWARKRHPKMSKYKLKEKYWHSMGKRNWVFGVKTNKKVILALQYHSKIPIKKYAKVKGTSSPFDGNIIYWTKRLGKNPLIPPKKARLIQEQKGYCGICRKAFLPHDIIEEDHIIPKAMGGLNLRSNVHVVHNYCHRDKTNKELVQIRRHRNRQHLN